MFLARPVMSVLLTPAYAGMELLLRMILPFRVGEGWNIFS
jgi:hypothetical protein